MQFKQKVVKRYKVLSVIFRVIKICLNSHVQVKNSCEASFDVKDKIYTVRKSIRSPVQI